MLVSWSSRKIVHGKVTKNGENFTLSVLWGRMGSCFPELFFLDGIKMEKACHAGLTKLRGLTPGEVHV